MKRYMMTGAVCVCLLIGSFYPKLILGHHLKLVDKNGKEMAVEMQYSDEIPLKLEFRFLELFH